MNICRICGATSNETRVYNDLCRKHYLQIKRHGKVLTRTIYDPNEIIINENNDYAIMYLYDKKGNKINETYLDLNSIDKVKNYKWYLRYSNKVPYVMGTIDGKKEFLHRFLLNVPDNKITDHINGNTLDNRINNLRICSQSENSKNRVYKSSKGKIPGVYQQYGPNSRWSARINYNYKTIHIGTFDTYEEAVKARYEAEDKYFGEFKARSGQLKQQNG